MKNMNIIKLLSVLLCIGMLFVACDDPKKENGNDNADPEQSAAANAEEESLLENVEPKFESFFEISEKETAILGKAERIEGEIVSVSSSVIVLKSSDVDTKNIVTEKFDVYNVDSGEIVLTLDNKYFNGAYAEFDWDELFVFDDSVRYPESVMDVKVMRVDTTGGGEFSVPYILVRSAEITEIDEKTREENPDGCIYSIETQYSYYDVYGTLIAKTGSGAGVSSAGDPYTIQFGSITAIFDEDSGAVRRIYDLDREIVDIVYDHENVEFGYYALSYDRVGPVGYMAFIDIYDKAEKRTDRYYLDTAYENAEVFYLHNGDVLCQYYSDAEDGSEYDFCVGGDQYYDLKHTVIDVRDGTEREIKLPYFIDDMVIGEIFAENSGIANNSISVSDNARNVANARRIEKKQLSDENIFIFDNDMKLLYEYDRIVPEHKIEIGNGLGFSMLQSGDYLVELNGRVADKAIVGPDGSIRSYLKSTMYIVGGFVFDSTTNSAYNYDLDEIMDLKKSGYELYDSLLGRTVLRQVESDEYISDYSYYCFLNNDGVSSMFGGEKVKITAHGNGYVVAQHEAGGRYTLYNNEMSALLTTYGAMQVYEFNGGYVVSTMIDGHHVLYRVD